MLDLAAIDSAICARLKASVPALVAVATLNSEDELTQDTVPPPCAYVLVRGGRFDEARGRSQLQEGQADVMVYLKALNVSAVRGAARAGADGVYELVQQAIAALAGWEPEGCHELNLAEFGVYRLPAGRFTACMALRFTLRLEIDHEQAP